jgi:hypothetical protein
MMRALAAQPVAATVAVGVVPGLWMVPATLAQEKLVSQNPHVVGLTGSLREMAVSYAVLAWSCIGFGGQLAAAISAVRGRPIRWRPFLAGTTKAPGLFLAGLVALLPVNLLQLLPRDPHERPAGILETVAVGAAIFLLARTAMWTPLLVDRRLTLLQGLRASWFATRGKSLRIVGVGVATSPLIIVAFVTDTVLFGQPYHLAFGIMGALYALALAQLYLVAGLAEGDDLPNSALQQTRPSRSLGPRS